MNLFERGTRAVLRMVIGGLDRGISLLGQARRAMPYVASAREEEMVQRALAVPPERRVVRCSDLGTRHEPNVWLQRAPAHDPRIAPILAAAIEEAGRRTKEAEEALRKKLAEERGGAWPELPEALPPIPPAGAEVPWPIIRLARQVREMSAEEPRFEEAALWLGALHRAHGTPDEIVARRVERLMSEEPPAPRTAGEALHDNLEGIKASVQAAAPKPKKKSKPRGRKA